MKYFTMLALLVPFTLMGQPFADLKKISGGDRIVPKGYWYRIESKSLMIQVEDESGQVQMEYVDQENLPPVMESLDIEVSGDYWIGKTEVSNGQYLEFMVRSVFDEAEAKQYWQFLEEGEGGNYLRWTKRLKERAMEKGLFPDYYDTEVDLMVADEELQNTRYADRPIRGVNWHQAVAYCQWLTEQPKFKAKGMVFRLPTEAEWIWAANGGEEMADLFAQEPMEMTDQTTLLGWTTSVTEGKPNGFGLRHFGGNVAEWTMDDWTGPAGSYGFEEGRDLSFLGENKIIKGGWVGAGSFAFEMGSRRLGRQNLGYAAVGFRVVAVKE